MAITIKRFRMSLFWNASFPTLFGDVVPIGAPLGTLGHRQSYALVFDTLLAAPRQPVTPQAAGAPALELPWPPEGTHRFWCRYLNANPIQRLLGSFAFFRLVPLRRHVSPVPGLGALLPQKLANGDIVALEQVLGEAWFHPHMVSFAVHFTVGGEMTPEGMSEVCLELRNSRILSVPGNSALCKLDEIAANRLNALLLEAVGEENAGPPPPANPFSIVTVLKGDGDIGPPIVEGGSIHCMLEAVTQWGVGKVGSLAAGRISSLQHPPDLPLLFGHVRSRAVWDPVKFSRAGGTSLSCYHRNLFVGAMQTEALLSYARVAELEAAKGNKARAIRDCADPVLKRIIALHKGEVETYRSASLRRFIDDHPFRPSVNTLAQRIWSKQTLPPLMIPAVSSPPNPATPPATP